MTETKHTPEPWKADGEDICQKQPGNLHVIATMHEWRDIDEDTLRIRQSTEYGIDYLVNLEFTGMGGGDKESNARRICAAVNACAGLSTEALESGMVKESLENNECYRRFIQVIADFLDSPDMKKWVSEEATMGEAIFASQVGAAVAILKDAKLLFMPLEEENRRLREELAKAKGETA